GCASGRDAPGGTMSLLAREPFGCIRDSSGRAGALHVAGGRPAAEPPRSLYREEPPRAARCLPWSSRRRAPCAAARGSSSSSRPSRARPALRGSGATASVASRARPSSTTSWWTRRGSGIAGPKAGTSPRRDGSGARSLRFYQFLAMQGALALALVGVAWLSRGDRRTVALCLVTLFVPLGWALVYELAHRRVESARKAGTWSAAWERAQGMRAMGVLGGIVLVWVLVAVLIVLYA